MTNRFASWRTLLCLLAMPLPLWAQEPAPQAGGEDELTDEELAEIDVLDIAEVTVTAQKREQDLQDVPVAVTALNAQDLILENVFSPLDIASLAPNLTFQNSLNSRNRAFFIRGLGTLSFSDGAETSVGIFVDGVIQGRDFQGLNEFFDLERVEVLRGPQGTLFGKNTSAGAISVVTKDPTYELGGQGFASYGSDNEVRLRGALNAPIVDEVLAVRMSGYFSQRDGVGFNAVLDQEIDDLETYGFRGKVLFEPINWASLTLSGDYQINDSTCCELYIRSPPPSPLPPPFALSSSLLAGGVDLSPIGEDNRTSFANTLTFEEVET